MTWTDVHNLFIIVFMIIIIHKEGSVGSEAAQQGAVSKDESLRPCLRDSSIISTEFAQNGLNKIILIFFRKIW